MSATIFDAQLSVAMQLAHEVAPRTKKIELNVANADGFVLANDVISQTDLPPFMATKVDGYAINGRSPWKLLGKNLAGSVSDLIITENSCIYVATGAALPQGTTAVIKQEDSKISQNLVEPIRTDLHLAIGENIRPRGYESTAGEMLIQSGTKLTPALLGLISASGLNKILVHKKPNIDVLILGDELVQSGKSGEGKVRDSIGPQIGSWLNHFGGNLTSIKHVADNLNEHVNAINQSNADLVITTGGTASGPADHLHSAIKKCGGTVLVDAVLVRPGYHQLIAQLPNKFLIGLPGNPQSAVIGLITLVSSFIAGATHKPRSTFESRQLTIDVSAPGNEHRLVLSRELPSSTKVGQISPVEHLDSSMLRGFVEADGYAIIQPGGMSAGSVVNWLPLPK